MGPTVLSSVLACALALGVARAGVPELVASPPGEVVEAVRSASVVVAHERCAGAVVEDGRHVATAAHCIRPEETRLAVTLSDGQEVEAELALIDRDSDMALLRLAERAPVEALKLADALPPVGGFIVFLPRVQAHEGPQLAQVARLGRCPTLPGVPQALFTTLRGVPGDSGAPLVDLEGRLVGLVHGGARCNIAAPTLPLQEVFAGTGGAGTFEGPVCR